MTNIQCSPQEQLSLKLKNCQFCHLDLSPKPKYSYLREISRKPIKSPPFDSLKNKKSLKRIKSHLFFPPQQQKTRQFDYEKPQNNVQNKMITKNMDGQKKFCQFRQGSMKDLAKVTINYLSPKKPQIFFNHPLVLRNDKPSIQEKKNINSADSNCEKEMSIKQSKITKHTRLPSETVFSRSQLADKKNSEYFNFGYEEPKTLKKMSLEFLSPKYIDSENEGEKSVEFESQQRSEVMERYQSPFLDLRNGFLNEPVGDTNKSIIGKLNLNDD